MCVSAYVFLQECVLVVIYALMQSDWLAQNLELEPRNPGRYTQTYFCLPPPAHFHTRMRIHGKIRLARETRMRACVCICVLARVCVCLRACLCVRPFVWAYVSVFNCMCVLSCVS